MFFPIQNPIALSRNTYRPANKKTLKYKLMVSIYIPIEVKKATLIALYITTGPADVVLLFLINVNLKPVLDFDSDPSHTFDSDSDSTLVFNPSPVFSLISVSFSIVILFPFSIVSRAAFNSDSATNHNSDLNAAEGKQFLHLLCFDPDLALDSDADPTYNFNPGPVFNVGPGPGSGFCSSSRFQFRYRY
ncbi:hypothetical protein EVAR_31464_1 [Eumeta japonica]|uniref:Uncharacterized protein n=1 Tax=Eumeta variegata TaxID=151549 RepID=A0A4C1WCN8_EUMVA|nr:hypothetical protein EVAR_31464_1 [Eumeta japonica]